MVVRKRGDTYQYDFRLNGKRYRKGGFETKRLARMAESELMIDIEDGMYNNDSITLAEYFKNYVDVYNESHHSKSTIANMAARLKSVEKHTIGHIPLKNITRLQYQNFINDYGKNHVQDSTRKMHRAIKNCVQDAIFEGIVKRDFTHNVAPKSNKASKEEKEKYFEVYEYKKLKELAKEKNLRSYMVLFLMICTGARVSGVLNLKYSFIDKTNCTLFINEKKTDTSPRYVEIGRDDMQHLVNYLNSTPIDMSGYVFAECGTVISNAAINKTLGKLCDKLNTTKRTSHSLRHTHCSFLLSQGISIYYISKRLGHKNIDTTLKYYSHLLEEQYESESKLAVNALNNL
ncbi:tyrosine-type recombinase/integrase [Staphylococcus ratti]|uniref:Site-specific integrase n=1 Tax=Staphylococcus ratti TaxID=2892440 RepID=A0ABY3PBR6_9STAP|nr:site-specific integrase [Staphylococcus ratti]UEX89729.1 site-specific integrase [Staphylococcus ratti]